MPPDLIRDAVIEDAEPIGALMVELGYPTTTAAMRDRLDVILSDPDFVTLVAEVDGQILGVAGAVLSPYYEKDGTYARLAVLVVSETARGRGIGSHLVDAVERWSAVRGAREIFVTTGLQRVDAHAFYERRGYSRTGYRFVKPLDPGPGD